ncbi:hypothetical protein [Pontibacter harenae]|uniref:hypothetical protein n=1 Tax=Pontibacter harenae TaxID=2894083 RepID=UPI001E28ACCF|nr:hypothetical protein [Pontibacter harenae]MCC9166814.1 hypothetical protein [Pontibacter harenae]
MKSTFTLMLSFVVGALLFSSCDKCDEVKYSRATTDDLEWLVYGQDDSIKFVNQDNVLLTFTRVNATENQLPGEGYSASDECIEKVDVQHLVTMQDLKNQHPTFGTAVTRSSDKLKVNVMLESRGMHEINVENPDFETLEVNGQNYSNVYEITADSTRTYSLKRLLFNKSHGVLYYELYDRREYKLVSDQ